MSKFLHSIIVSCFTILLGVSSFAQTNEERRERADKFFEKEKYVEATSDYLHLLSLEPRSADLNFRYGACLLYNSNKKSEAIRYLKYATMESNIDPRAFYFFGLALHLNYQFDEAQRSYGTYVNLTMGKSDKRYPVDRQIEMCNNGKRLLTTFTDIIVAEKQEIDNEKFFRIYTDANTIGGDILVTAKFQSKLDQKMGHVPIVHFPPDAKAIYYSSYGDNLNTGLDIYIRRKLPNGEWGDPQLLPGAVNTQYDEDFPYMHPSGKYLYFSSTGHNSMGGYDIYLSKFDPNTNSFREPENVDFAISSPDDDFFYVVDSAFQNAYFASARQSQDGMLHVYRVKVARVPLKEVIIMGEFISEVDPNLKSMDINLTYHSNGKDVGLVRTNKVGKYSYVFPQGGKYNYQINIEGVNEEFKFTVELPFLDELRPLKQKIVHTKEEGQDVVKIYNLFDEDVENAEAIIAEVIRKKAELDVNIDKFDVEELEREARNKELLAKLGFENMSPSEVGEKLHELIDNSAEKQDKIEQVSDNLDAEILAKAERINELNEIQQELTEKALKTDDPITKHKLLTEASQKEAQKNSLLAMTDALVALKNDVNSSGANSGGSNDLAKLENLSRQYDELIRADKVQEALDLLASNRQVLSNATKGTPEDLISTYVSRANELREEIRAEGKKEQTINGTIESANQELNKLQGDLEQAKKKDVPTIERQIRDKQEEIEMSKVDLRRSRERKSELARELSNIETQIASLQNALSTEEHVAVNQSQLDESIKKVKEIETTEPTVNYVEEIARIEEASPALFNNQASVYETVKTNLGQERSAVQKDNKLSEAEKLAREEEMIQNALSDLEARKEVINERLKDGPSDELARESEKIAQYETELKNELDKVEQDLAELRSANPDIAYSKTDIQKEIDPNLEIGIKAIENSDKSEQQKIEELRTKLNQFEAKLNEEKTSLERALQNNPNDAESEARKALIEELLSDTEKRQEKLNQREERYLAENRVKPADEESLMPGFNEMLSNANAISDQRKSVEQQQQVYRALQDKIANERKQLEKQIKKSSNDQNLKDQDRSLAQLEENTLNEIERLETELKEIDVAVDNKKYGDPTTYLFEYETRRSEILNNGQNEEKTLSALVELNNELITAISAVKADLRNEGGNDDAIKSIDAYVATLEAQQKELKDQLSNTREVASFSFNTTEEAKDQLYPEYQEKRDALMIDAATEEERNSKLLMLNNELLELINEAENAVDNVLAGNPSDENARKSKLQLSQLEKQLENENAELESTSVAVLNEDQILSNYSQDVSQIKDNYSGEEERSKLLELENALNNAIKSELIGVDKVLSNDPENQEALTKKRDLLRLEAENYKRIKSLEPEGDLVTYNSKDELISAVVSPEIVKALSADIEGLDQFEKDALKNNLVTVIDQVNKLRAEMNNAAVEEFKKQENLAWLEEVLDDLNNLSDRLDDSNIVASTISKDELVKNYEERREKINSDSGISEITRLEKLSQLDEELISSGTKSISSLDKKLNKNPDDEESAVRKAAISNEIAAAESRIAENDQTIAALNTNLTTEDVKIYADRNALESAILSARLNDLRNKDVTALTDVEKNELRELLQQKISEINTLRTALSNANVDQDKKQLNIDWYNAVEAELNQIQDSLGASEIATLQISRDELLNNYTQRKSEIEENASIAEQEKLIQLNALEEDLISSAQKEVASLDKKLKKNPDDITSAERKDAIESEINGAQSRIAQNDQAMNALNSDAMDWASERNRLVSDYDTKKAELSSKGDNRALLDLEHELLESIANQIKTEEKANPESSRLQSLKERQIEQEQVVEQLMAKVYAGLTANEKVALLDEILPGYTDQADKLRADQNDNELIALETRLQDKLNDKIAGLEKQQARKPSVSVDMELYTLRQLLKESKVRVDQVSSTSEDVAEQERYLETLRSVADVSDINELELKTVEELEKADLELAQYESFLSEEIERVKNEMVADATPQSKKELKWLEQEREEVKARRRKIKISIGELEQEFITSDDPQLNAVREEIAQLERELNNPDLSAKEKADINAKLSVLNTEKVSIENKNDIVGIEQNQAEFNAFLSNEANNAEEGSVVKEVKEYHEAKQKIDEERLAEIADISDPNKQAYELEKYKAEQESEQSDLREMVIGEKIDAIEKQNDIDLITREELETRKRRFVVRFGELTREIENAKDEKANAKKKDQPAIDERIEVLEQEKAIVQAEIERIENRLIELPEEQRNSVQEAYETSVSFKEERELAMTDEYHAYEPVGKIAARKAQRINEIESELNVLKGQLKEQLLLETNNESDPELKQELITEIRNLEEEVDRLRIELVQDEYRANQLLPSNKEDAMKMKNLVARGVKPIKASVVAAALLNMPSSGFAIGEKLSPGEARAMPIAVGVEYPEGLVYRVQVGAFARPIPAELFSEFTPVTGEKIDGTNITRYMAGYFNDSQRVTEAREQIRSLGYNDAFIIAYCNGKRIHFGEARRLEEAGICVPKRENELMLEVAEHTAEKLGVSLQQTATEVEEHDYNKAPGAAEAEAIEDMKGLFFTVQIGVFNKPVGEEHLHEMNEILTFRLPNGQIRYSSGIFNSIDEAKPRRTQALTNGVVGAFITAYYNGERIPLWEAKQILADQGESVLYTNQTQVKKEEVKPPVVIKEEETVIEEEVVPVHTEDNLPRVQIVTTKQFDEYPRDILNRYNTEGTFYYDEEDRRVKSIIYQDEEHLPRLFNFRRDIDTVFIDEITFAETQRNTLKVTIESQDIPGDLMDWLLRSSIRRIVAQEAGGIMVYLKDIKEEKQQEIIDRLRAMGYVPELIEGELIEE